MALVQVIVSHICLIFSQGNLEPEVMLYRTEHGEYKCNEKSSEEVLKGDN